MLYKQYVKMHIKSSMQFKANTFVLTLSSIGISVAEILTIFILFSGFKAVGEWSFYETALMFGIITTVFAFVECFSRGFDEFANIIKNGDLDRILVRPVGVIYQIFGQKIQFSKLPKSMFGLLVSIIAILKLNVVWTWDKILVLALTFICGCFVILGVMMIGAGISVFTVENLEFLNIITNGSKELCYYPINIYNKWLARFFTFIIPMACFNYLPISYIMGHGNLPPIIYALSPVIGALFIIPCIIFFKWALTKYQSTGT